MSRTQHLFKIFGRISGQIVSLSIVLVVNVYAMAQTAPPQGSGSQDIRGAVVALYTPFAFFQNSLQSLMASYSAQDSSNFPDQVVSVDGINWHISGINYSIQSDFNQGNLQAHSYDIASRNLKLNVTINQISVDQIVTSQQSGVTLDVHVQAICSPIQLSQNTATASATIAYNFSPQSITTEVTQFNFQWPKQTWAISSLHCQGPTGIDSKILSALQTNLQSADTLKPYIQDALAAKIQEQVDTILGQIKRPAPILVPGSPLNMVLSFRQFQIGKTGLLSFGQITWNGAPNSDQITPLDLTDVPAELANATGPVLITANAGWTNLIKAELAAAPPTTLISLNDQASLQKLLNSNLYDFFLWPDLMNYPRKAPFNLSIDTPTLTSLTWMTDGSARLQATPAAWVQATRDSKVWNYVRLSGEATAQITPQIVDGVFSIRADVKTSNIQYVFGDDYVSTYQPNTVISPLVISQIAKNLDRSFTFTNALPSYDLGAIGTARFNGWKPISSGTYIAIPVEMK